MSWVVCTPPSQYALNGQIQEALRQATGLPVSDVRTMDQVVVRSTSRQRFNMWLMTAFGISALTLAAIGIYGLMAYSVEQRTQEIGIRLALGADAGQVRRMIVGQGMLLAAVGVVVGVGLALLLAKFMEGFLFGVQPRDLLLRHGPIVLTLVAFAAA
jgi:ABC-type antimicrobial peptide transport system permease subunit